MSAEFAGDNRIRLTIRGEHAAAAGDLATVTLETKAALRLADDIHKTSELMRRMAALVRAEKAAGEVP